MYEQFPQSDARVRRTHTPRAVLRRISSLPHAAKDRAYGLERDVGHYSTKLLHGKPLEELTQHVTDLPASFKRLERNVEHFVIRLPDYALEVVVTVPQHAMSMERSFERLGHDAFQMVKHQIEPFHQGYCSQAGASALAVTLPALRPLEVPSLPELATSLRDTVAEGWERIRYSPPLVGLLMGAAIYAGLAATGLNPARLRHADFSSRVRAESISNLIRPSWQIEAPMSGMREYAFVPTRLDIKMPTLEELAKDAVDKKKSVLFGHPWGANLDADAALLAQKGIHVPAWQLVYAARTLYFEEAKDPAAGNDMDKLKRGYQGIVNVILNRQCRGAYGGNLYEILHSRTPCIQFNAVYDNPAYFQLAEIRAKQPNLLRGRKMNWARAHLAYVTLVEGLLHQHAGLWDKYDITEGAEFYRNPDFSCYTPFWQSLRQTTAINSHRFYREKTEDEQAAELEARLNVRQGRAHAD